MRLARALAVGAAVALAVTACGGDDEGPGGSDGTTDEPQSGGTIRDTLTQDVDTLLPMDSNVGDNIGVLEVVYSGLVRYDNETAEPYNYIAEEITPNDDNTVWTIKIKDGFTFHNGEPVNAESFKRAWDLAAYGPNAYANNYFFGNIAGYEEMQGEYEEDDEGNVTVIEDPAAEELSGVKVIDDLTLEVTLTAPFAGYQTVLGYTGFFPIAQECADDLEACATQPIGNGPFKVDEWNRGVSMTATKFADYAGDEVPNYDTIEWTEYSGDSSWADFQAGNVDFSAPPPAELEPALNDAELQERYVERTGVALTYLGFPMYKGEPYTNPDFRKAISLAVDVQAIIDQVLAGQGEPATSWVPEGSILGGTSGTCEFCRFDPDEAKQLLENAGGWPEGEKLTIHFGADPTSEAFFKALGDQLKLNLGIDYQLDPTEDFFARRTEQDFDGVYRNNWFADYPMNENYLGPVGYAAGSVEDSKFGWYSEEFEAKLAEGAKAATVEEAVALYQEAELILAEEFPTVPLYIGKNYVFHSENVSNIMLDPFSGAVELRSVEFTGSM